ncbi:hypothetical protein KP509_18G034300 [Ceratopteris richardii]|uniref:Auxin response factor n=1 Tax=Ceratopteris richardii TaxID=49495 RepID=A0A8T2SSC9_CERRI|nr:hypothetical protein KP509_18G034300 [Ceratopteris richardii]
MAETSGGLRLRVPADPELWRACAGTVSHLPQVGSSVVYFPQGHLEQALPSPHSFTGFPFLVPACIACKVTSIDYLAELDTDQAYARMSLRPMTCPDVDDAEEDDQNESSSFSQEGKPLSFAKTLTQSDANNGGGFSIPRYCADTIFPRLDYTQTPPVQKIQARDIQGTIWTFRHIYRGTPRRHLLTTGWSNFVNQKKLVAGDVIVFIRTSGGQLCVGIRRSIKSWRLQNIPPQCGPQSDTHHAANQRSSSSSVLAGMNASNFSRHRSALVTSQSVVDAVTAAISGQSFEILYYPRAAASEFCVKLKLVNKALQYNWASGMRFKMAVETEDASRTSWYLGTILEVEEVDPVQWPKSPWKVLRVTWDEGVLQGIHRVSPWEVDLVSPMLLPPFSWPRKKLRPSHPEHSSVDGSRDTISITYQGIQASNVQPHCHVHRGFSLSVEEATHGSNHEPSNQAFRLDIQNCRTDAGSLHSEVQFEEGFERVAGLRTGLEQSWNKLNDPTDTEKHLFTSTVGSSSSSEPLMSSSLSFGDEGGSSSSKSAQFLLFGKTIDILQPPIFEPLQLTSYVNGPNETGQEVISEGPQSEVSVSAEQSSLATSEAAPDLNLQREESLTAP